MQTNKKEFRKTNLPPEADDVSGTVEVEDNEDV